MTSTREFRSAATSRPSVRSYPQPSALLELLKPITWFPPMWAFACGVVSSGQPILTNWRIALTGIVLAGPLVCAMSQAINDWCDREVDAINEPNRPIPSGRMPGRWGLYVAIVWTLLSLLAAATLGLWVFISAAVGLALAWAYSAEPFRLKRNGWLGNAACGFSYEGLAWVTGAAAMLGGSLPPRADPLACVSLQRRRARNHDAKRLQVDQRRYTNRHQLGPGFDGTQGRGLGGELHHGGAAGRRDWIAAFVGPWLLRGDRRRLPARANRDDVEIHWQTRRARPLV